jgi:hypothetical protein
MSTAKPSSWTQQKSSHLTISDTAQIRMVRTLSSTMRVEADMARVTETPK